MRVTRWGQRRISALGAESEVCQERRGPGGDKVRHGGGQGSPWAGTGRCPTGAPRGDSVAWHGTTGVGRDTGCVIRAGRLGSVSPPKGVAGGRQTPQRGPLAGEGDQDGRIPLSKDPILGRGGPGWEHPEKQGPPPGAEGKGAHPPSGPPGWMHFTRQRGTRVDAPPPQRGPPLGVCVGGPAGAPAFPGCSGRSRGAAPPK